VGVSTTRFPDGRTDPQHPAQSPALRRADHKLFEYGKAEQSAGVAAEMQLMT